MKKVSLLVLALCLIPVLARGGPFLRCDQYTSNPPDYFKLFIDSGSGFSSPTYIYPSETGASIHYDLASLPAGQHTIKAEACKAANPPWQATEVCSADSTPFTFVKPAPVGGSTVPANLGLSAQ